jgi:hypothetical protein
MGEIVGFGEIVKCALVFRELVVKQSVETGNKQLIVVELKSIECCESQFEIC